MNRTNKSLTAAGIVFLCAVAAANLATAAKVGSVDGLWVMQKVDDRYEGDDVQEDMLVTLVRTTDLKQRTRTMQVRWLKKDYGKEDGLVVHFIEPLFAKGVTLSMTIKPYLDDERWMYFPEMNMISRIEAKDQHSNFMGTDFTYYDLAEREPDEENHKLLRIEEFDGKKCYVVETTPKEGTEDYYYSRKEVWVDAENFTKLRIKYYNRAQKFEKQYDALNWEKISNILTPTRLVMEDYIAGHKTTIDRTNIRYNTSIDDEYFKPHRVDCIKYEDGKFSLLPMEERPTRVWAEKRKRSADGRRGASSGDLSERMPPKGGR